MTELHALLHWWLSIRLFFQVRGSGQVYLSRLGIQLNGAFDLGIRPELIIAAVW